MIKSMTGYGIANFENEAVKITVEIKTLNSKYLDLNLKSPRQFSDKEIEIRNLIAKKLERGKVNLTIDLISKGGGDLPISINDELFVAYFEKFEILANRVGTDTKDLFRLAFQSPNVISSAVETEQGEGDWELVRKVLLEAIEGCDQFRMDEGGTLYSRFEENLKVLEEGLELVKRDEPLRKEKIQNRIRDNFSEWLEESSFDQNRFEQELIYYLEKLDITEEVVRLKTHLDYFRKTLASDRGQGKKLGFISQELGREINTIGSKANDATIQRHVILMKDELEKIKE